MKNKTQELLGTTKLCPTCGCSLVRLGTDTNIAPSYQYNETTYYFCCTGCVKLFIEDPTKFINEIKNIIVCPVCLSEKPVQQSIKLDYKGNGVFFCRCTHCQEEFSKNPAYYLDRLEGRVDYKGVFGNTCC